MTASVGSIRDPRQLHLRLGADHYWFWLLIPPTHSVWRPFMAVHAAGASGDLRFVSRSTTGGFMPDNILHFGIFLWRLKCFPVLTAIHAILRGRSRH